MKKLIVVLLALFIFTPSAYSNYVRGYVKKNGTYVAPHYRNSPSNSSAYKPTPYHPHATHKTTVHHSTPKYRTTQTPHSRTSHAKCTTCARDSHCRIQRSEKAITDFKATNPCPSTGKKSGSCPGYIIDHVIPLKRGGADQPYNMQWQTVEQAKEKDKTE